MLVNCKQGCRISSTTEGLLDVESNDVICKKCGKTLDGISNFAKQSMRSRGDILKKAKNKAFSFDCKTCKKHKEVISKNGEVLGKDCPLETCSFDISGIMKSTIHTYKSTIEATSDTDEGVNE